MSLNALNSLARILGGLPGRKSIIWVTGNPPFSLVPEIGGMSDAELGETLPSLDTRRVGEHVPGIEAAASVNPTLRRSGNLRLGWRARRFPFIPSTSAV